MNTLPLIFTVFSWIAYGQPLVQEQDPSSTPVIIESRARHGTHRALVLKAQIADYVFPLRDRKPVRIYNPYGAIEVVGWSQDKVTAKAMIYSSSRSRQAFFKTVEWVADAKGKELQITAQLSSRLSLLERVKGSRSIKEYQPIDIKVMVPNSLAVTAITASGDVQVKNFSGNIQIQTLKGSVSLDKINSELVYVSTVDAAVNMKDSKLTGNISIRSGDIYLEKISGGLIQIDGENIKINALNIKNEMRVQSSSLIGKLSEIEKPLNIYAKTLEYEMTEVFSSVFATFAQGTIKLDLARGDKVRDITIQTLDADIDLWVYDGFSAKADVESTNGKINMRIPFFQYKQPGKGPEPQGRIIGTFYESINRESFTHKVNLSSKRGVVSVSKKETKR